MDIGDDLVARANHLGVQLVDQLFETIVDDHAVLSCFGKRGVAHNALVVGVLVDCAHGGFIELRDLVLQRRGHLGAQAGKLIELLFSFSRVDLALTSLAQ